jgi:hypothetical protein
MNDTTLQPGTEPANPLDANKVAASTTSFGFSSVSLPTPKWANAAFDIYLIVITSFLAWIVADNIFSKEVTQHIFYFFTLFLTPIIKGLSKMFGVKVDDSKQ